MALEPETCSHKHRAGTGHVAQCDHGTPGILATIQAGRIGLSNLSCINTRSMRVLLYKQLCDDSMHGSGSLNGELALATRASANVWVQTWVAAEGGTWQWHTYHRVAL